MRELNRAAEWVARLGQEAGLPADLSFHLDLCLAEALANVVEHGFAPGHPSHEVLVRFEAAADWLSLVIEDDGKAFDPLALPPRRRPRRLEDAEPGGLGVPLIRRFAHAWRYERKAGRNHLTLSWRRPPAIRAQGLREGG